MFDLVTQTNILNHSLGFRDEGYSNIRFQQPIEESASDEGDGIATALAATKKIFRGKFQRHSYGKLAKDEVYLAASNLGQYLWRSISKKMLERTRIL